MEQDFGPKPELRGALRKGAHQLFVHFVHMGRKGHAAEQRIGKPQAGTAVLAVPELFQQHDLRAVVGRYARVGLSRLELAAQDGCGLVGLQGLDRRPQMLDGAPQLPRGAHKRVRYSGDGVGMLVAVHAQRRLLRGEGLQESFQLGGAFPFNLLGERAAMQPLAFKQEPHEVVAEGTALVHEQRHFACRGHRVTLHQVQVQAYLQLAGFNEGLGQVRSALERRRVGEDAHACQRPLAATCAA